MDIVNLLIGILFLILGCLHYIPSLNYLDKEKKRTDYYSVDSIRYYSISIMLIIIGAGMIYHEAKLFL